MPKKNGKLGLSDAAWAFITSKPKTCDRCHQDFRSTDTREPFRCWRCTVEAAGQLALDLRGERTKPSARITTHATPKREQGPQR